MSYLKPLCAIAALALVLPIVAHAAHHEESAPPVRAEAIQIAATVVAVDAATREISLQVPHGDIVTMTLGPDRQRFDEIAVGDAVVATYIQSLAGDVREPTAEELAEPWIELDATAIADLDMDPGVADMRVIRAVCTIEGINRVTKTAMIQDPRGKYHVITGVDPARMKGVTLGTKIIMVYSQAVALTLEKAPSME